MQKRAAVDDAAADAKRTKGEKKKKKKKKDKDKVGVGGRLERRTPPLLTPLPTSKPLFPQDDEASEAWKQYMAEVKKYEEATCKEFNGCAIVK